MFHTEIAIFITVSTITFSLFLFKILKYIISMGNFFLFYLIIFSKCECIEISIIISFFTTLFLYFYYEEIGQDDPLSILLLIAISAIGLFFLSSIIINYLDLIANKCTCKIKILHFSPTNFNSILNKTLK